MLKNNEKKNNLENLIIKGQDNVSYYDRMFDNNIEDKTVIPYDSKELMLIVQDLVNKYTSFESSSVSYETANMLMEAIIYCIKDGGYYNLPAKIAYEKGYKYVVEKVKKTNDLYTDIVSDFNDYGCRCYRDTVIKGMPAFFINYDARYCPQDEILTLDYPTLRPLYYLHGIDKIYIYLYYTYIEQKFLAMFDEKFVRQTLEENVTDYEELFFDNICCVILEKVIVNFVGEEKLIKYITEYSKEQLKSKFEYILKGMIENMCLKNDDLKNLGNDDVNIDKYMFHYLKYYMKDLTVIVCNKFKVRT